MIRSVCWDFEENLRAGEQVYNDLRLLENFAIDLINVCSLLMSVDG